MVLVKHIQFSCRDINSVIIIYLLIHYVLVSLDKVLLCWWTAAWTLQEDLDKRGHCWDDRSCVYLHVWTIGYKIVTWHSATGGPYGGELHETYDVSDAATPPRFNHTCWLAPDFANIHCQAFLSVAVFLFCFPSLITSVKEAFLYFFAKFLKK